MVNPGPSLPHAHGHADAGLVDLSRRDAMESMSAQEQPALMVVIRDGRISEIRMDTLQRVLSWIAAMAVREGEIRIEDEEDGTQ